MGGLLVALVIGVCAELLVLACALTGVSLRRRRTERLVARFAAAGEQARQAAFRDRIVAAHLAELAELEADSRLEQLGLGPAIGLDLRSLPGLGAPSDPELGPPPQTD